MEKNENERAKEQAKAQLDGITEMIKEYNDAINVEDDDKMMEAEERIGNDPLSVEVRSLYRILLCWGGPAVQIIGDLNQWNEPETAELQYQDWFTYWENYPLSREEEEILLEYARHFYYGD